MQYRLNNRANKSITYSLPAPIKGLNCRDSIADMQESFALTMDNYIPLDNHLVLRKGYMRYISMNSKVCTLATYLSGYLTRFFAVSGKKIWNISNKNNVFAYDDYPLNTDYCRTAQYKNYLYFVNGIDIPKVFYVDSGGHEHFENWNFSGENLDSRSLINVCVSKQRLWFVENMTLRAWYAEQAGNVSGTLQCFDLSQVCRFGGHLLAVANWTQDGGQGIDDLTVFITSEGEVLVYSGADVNNIEEWKLRGSFKISRPIGYNCTIQYQGDVVIISEDGYIPLSAALPLDKANSSQIAFSDAIRGLVLERTQKYFARQGWEGLIYSRGGYGLFNVPFKNTYEQHVININTGAWCRFTNINSHCWKECDKRLYFGSDDGVYLFDEGYSDDGKPIYGEVAQAYSNLGTERLKKIQLLNPRTKSASRYALVIYTNMDMEEQNLDYEEDIGNSGTTKWNIAKWSSSENLSGAKWENSGRSALRSQWLANSATGYKVSIVFKTKTSGNRIEWYETDIRYEVGEGVL